MCNTHIRDRIRKQARERVPHAQNTEQDGETELPKAEREHALPIMLNTALVMTRVVSPLGIGEKTRVLPVDTIPSFTSFLQQSLPRPGYLCQQKR